MIQGSGYFKPKSPIWEGQYRISETVVFPYMVFPDMVRVGCESGAGAVYEVCFNVARTPGVLDSIFHLLSC